MPNNTDRQRKRRKEAIFSGWLHTALTVLSGILLLFLRHRYQITGVWGTVMLLSAIVEIGMTIPIQYILHIRLKEIQGGEEDAAAQY